MFEKRVVVGKQYCVITPGPVVISASINNIDTKLVNATESGKYFFIAPTTKIYSSIDTKCIFEPDNTLNYNIGNSPCWLYSLKTALHILLDGTAVKINLSQNKLVIQVSNISDTQLQTVSKLLDQVLPHNLETEIEWANGLPIEYTHVEYLEGGQKQNIDSGVIPTDETRIEAEFSTTNNRYNGTYFCATHDSRFGASLSSNTYVLWGRSTSNLGDLSLRKNIKTFILFQRGYIAAGNKSITFECESLNDYPTSNTVILNLNKIQDDGSAINKWYSCQIFTGDAIVRNFIPALNQEGQPGMYDTVSKVFKTNSGTGDFLYPGTETQATTYSLRNRMYGKITEHGIRRLYRVPAGYNGSKEEYAEQNGFKLLVETPMPEEGYWTPEWRETETQLILDWVETEPISESLV